MLLCRLMTTASLWRRPAPWSFGCCSGKMPEPLLLKLRAKDILAGRPWSGFSLQRAFAWEVAQTQVQRSSWQMALKWLQPPKVA
jgi:hypothetical protein